MTKLCRTCNTVRDTTDFSKRARSKDGLSAKCKQCAAQYDKVRFLLRHEECLTRFKRYRQDNAEQLRQYDSERYYADHEVNKARRRSYYEQNKESFVDRAHRRRQVIEDSGWRLTKSWWMDKVAEQGDACAYCHRVKKLTVDHVVPLSRGGQHAPENIAGACETCNKSKGDKLLSEWAGPPAIYLDKSRATAVAA